MRANRNLKLKKRDHGCSEGQYIESIVLLQTVGGDCPEDTSLLAGDECLERGLGFALHVRVRGSSPQLTKETNRLLFLRICQHMRSRGQFRATLSANPTDVGAPNDNAGAMRRGTICLMPPITWVKATPRDSDNARDRSPKGGRNDCLE